MFTGKYSDKDTLDFMAGTAGLVSHFVAGLGMQSAGNISFALSKTVFAGALRSNGSTALLQSVNASVTFGSSAGAEALLEAAAGDSEGSMFARRLLQSDDGRVNRMTEHLVGGLGFKSKGIPVDQFFADPLRCVSV